MNDYQSRREACASRVTIDGRPAVITGAREPFAHVRSLDGVSDVEFSWVAIARVLDKGGAFRS